MLPELFYYEKDDYVQLSDFRGAWTGAWREVYG